MKRVAAFLFGLIGVDSASAISLKPVITGFQSKERITHLAPGGANAARELEISVQLFDEAGRIAHVGGQAVELVARDKDLAEGTVVGRLNGHTSPNGSFSGRMMLSGCRSPLVKGPIRVHRISNRPAYWDVTYVGAAVRVGSSNNGVEFVHVCGEVFRGSRP